MSEVIGCLFALGMMVTKNDFLSKDGWRIDIKSKPVEYDFWVIRKDHVKGKTIYIFVEYDESFVYIKGYMSLKNFKNKKSYRNSKGVKVINIYEKNLVKRVIELDRWLKGETLNIHYSKSIIDRERLILIKERAEWLYKQLSKEEKEKLKYDVMSHKFKYKNRILYEEYIKSLRYHEIIVFKEILLNLIKLKG